MIAGIVFVILFCIAAGCTGFSMTKNQNAGSMQNSDGGSDGSSSGNAKGSSSTGSYPQNSYFTFDCKGEWKDSTISGQPPWNHHGSFIVTGNVPFPITYDYNVVGFGLYTATDAAGSGMSNALHIQGESQECVGAASDCKPCHFIFDGEIYAGGLMVYNRSADSSRRWTVVFTRMPGGENGIWHTTSFRQTEGGCPITDVEQVGPLDIVGPADACFTKDMKDESGTPFSFSDSSGFVVSPSIDPLNVEFSKMEPNVVFHLGKAPS